MFDSPPMQYEGTISEFVERHVVPNLPSPAAIQRWCEVLLDYYGASPDPICVVRGTPRGQIAMVEEEGRPYRVVRSDNSPGIWAFTHCRSGDVAGDDLRWRLDHGRLPIFAVLKREEKIGQNYGLVLPAKEKAIWQQGWKLCHILAAKGARDAVGSGLISRSLRNLCPVNHFLWPSPRRFSMQRIDWSESANVTDLGESRRVIAWVQHAHYDCLSDQGRSVYHRYLEATAGTLPPAPADGRILVEPKLTDRPTSRPRTPAPAHESSSTRKPKDSLREGAFYTREEIHDLVGGGSLQSYLPNRDGVILCACLSPELNPDAPEIILPGTGSGIERDAEILRQQRVSIPTFLKRGTGAWEYRGHYSVDDRRWTLEDIRTFSRRTGRNDITSVIWMEKVDV